VVELGDLPKLLSELGNECGARAETPPPAGEKGMTSKRTVELTKNQSMTLLKAIELCLERRLGSTLDVVEANKAFTAQERKDLMRIWNKIPRHFTNQ